MLDEWHRGIEAVAWHVARCIAGGMGRAGGPNVYVGGRIGATLFDEGDPSAQNRPLDELRFPLDHFCTKILPLPVQMNTAPGRALAIERENFTKQFLDVMLNVLRPEITRD